MNIQRVLIPHKVGPWPELFHPCPYIIAYQVTMRAGEELFILLETFIVHGRPTIIYDDAQKNAMVIFEKPLRSNLLFEKMWKMMSSYEQKAWKNTIFIIYYYII